MEKQFFTLKKAAEDELGQKISCVVVLEAVAKYEHWRT